LLKARTKLLHKKDTTISKQVKTKLLKIIDKAITKNEIYAIKQSIKKIVSKSTIKTNFKNATKIYNLNKKYNKNFVQIFISQSSINSSRKRVSSKRIKTLVNLNRKKKNIDTINKYKDSNNFKSLQIKYIIFNLINSCKITLYIDL